VPDQFTITNPTSYGLTTDVFFGLDTTPFPTLLPTATCAFTPADRHSAHPNLHADVRGWQVIPDATFLPKLVSLHAEVHGTIDDAAGHPYRLDGAFDESGLQPEHVPFDGYGHLALAGSAGVVAGKARFTYVDDNPIGWGFLFTSIENCNIK
jgi:hypothetical protein